MGGGLRRHHALDLALAEAETPPPGQWCRHAWTSTTVATARTVTMPISGSPATRARIAPATSKPMANPSPDHEHPSAHWRLRSLTPSPVIVLVIVRVGLMALGCSLVMSRSVFTVFSRFLMTLSNGALTKYHRVTLRNVTSIPEDKPPWFSWPGSRQPGRRRAS